MRLVRTRPDGPMTTTEVVAAASKYGIPISGYGHPTASVRRDLGTRERDSRGPTRVRRTRLLVDGGHTAAAERRHPVPRRPRTAAARGAAPGPPPRARARRPAARAPRRRRTCATPPVATGGDRTSAPTAGRRPAPPRLWPWPPPPAFPPSHPTAGPRTPTGPARAPVAGRRGGDGRPDAGPWPPPAELLPKPLRQLSVRTGLGPQCTVAAPPRMSPHLPQSGLRKAPDHLACRLLVRVLGAHRCLGSSWL